MKTTAFTERGLLIGAEEIPVVSGAVHYWRHRRADWPRILDGVKDMGFRMVETYLPWSVHEISPGCYDFEGDKDVGAFLTMARERGLYAIVRPGPHINAELTGFGYPEWILWDERIMARGPNGAPVIYPYVTKLFPIPSYASEKLYRETEKYFHALKPVIEPHVWPNGCIVAAQADNELCYFFRDAAYALDYAEDSLALYRQMLRERYGRVEALNERYQSAYGDFWDVRPPAGYDSNCPARCLDWVRYKEYQVLRGVERMAALLPEAGLRVAVFHNCAYQHYTPVSVQRLEALPDVEVAGIDAYGEPGDVSMLKTRVRYLAGSSRLPFIPEFGSGSWFDRECLLSPEDEEYAYLYALMNGLKAVNFYMLAERDRWTGCPVRQDGQRREGYFELFRRLIGMLEETKLFTFRREVPILVLKDYDMGRLKAAYSGADYGAFASNCFVADTQFPRELFRPEDKNELIADERLHQWWEEAWVDALTERVSAFGLDYDLSDRYIPGERLVRYAAVLASVNPQTDGRTEEMLLSYARAGGRLAVGPRPPRAIAALLNGQTRISFGLGSVELLAEPEKFETALRPRISADDARVETACFTRDGMLLLFAANTSAKTIEATLCFEGKKRFRPLWRGGALEGLDRVTVALPAHTVALWQVEASDV